MNPADIRRTAIIAMFSDDWLMERVVLKGGNALDLVHGLSARGSLDIDFSIEGDFEDLSDVRGRIFRALQDRFDSVGLIVFDLKFTPKPDDWHEKWGGYVVEFKVISKKITDRLGGSLETLRRNANVIGPKQQRVFRIEISKNEYCTPKIRKDFEAYTVYVYTLEMIAVEKLRAICQQMPEYSLVKKKRARARDFYDIYTVVTRAKVQLCSNENRDLVRAIFGAKNVPVRLLDSIAGQREIHRPDWPAVIETLTEQPADFDFYFDFVLEETKRLLKALGEE